MKLTKRWYFFNGDSGIFGKNPSAPSAFRLLVRMLFCWAIGDWSVRDSHSSNRTSNRKPVVGSTPAKEFSGFPRISQSRHWQFNCFNFVALTPFQKTDIRRIKWRQKLQSRYYYQHIYTVPLYFTVSFCSVMRSQITVTVVGRHRESISDMTVF